MKPKHPGEILREKLYRLRMSQTELAKRLGKSRAAVNKLIHGGMGVSSRMAVLLGRVVGPSAEAWLQYQARFDLAEARRRK